MDPTQNSKFKRRRNVNLIVGIDPGTITGFACWWNGTLFRHESWTAVKIENIVLELANEIGLQNTVVIVEDASVLGSFVPWTKQAKNAASARAQGAGSVKRDSKRWIEFLQYHNINYLRISPRENTFKKQCKEYIIKAIGEEIHGVTNQHARDAISCAYVGRKILKIMPERINK